MSKIVEQMLATDALADLPRMGWVMRGVGNPESIAAHSFGVAQLTLLFITEAENAGIDIDGAKAMKMALIHDIPEAKMSDIPAPIKQDEVRASLREAERKIAKELLPDKLMIAFEEWLVGQSIESRLVRAADKIHVRIKALTYAKQHRGDVSDFLNRDLANPAPEIRAIDEVIAELKKRADSLLAD